MSTTLNDWDIICLEAIEAELSDLQRDWSDEKVRSMTDGEALSHAIKVLDMMILIYELKNKLGITN